jgi:hypothetical protein
MVYQETLVGFEYLLHSHKLPKLNPVEIKIWVTQLLYVIGVTENLMLKIWELLINVWYVGITHLELELGR